MFSRFFSFGTKRTKRFPPTRAAVALGLAGLLLLLVSGFIATSTHLGQTGIRTEAEVVTLEGTEGAYFPVFRFRDNGGRELTVRSKASSSRYFPGDEVPIVYDPQKPLNASIDDPLMLYVLSGILAFMGAVFSIGAFVVWKILAADKKPARKKRRKR